MDRHFWTFLAYFAAAALVMQVVLRLNAPEPQESAPLEVAVDEPSLPRELSEPVAAPLPQELSQAIIVPPAVPAISRGKIAVVIDDLGVGAAGTEKAIGLPAPITLAFLGYADNLGAQSVKAFEAGHEVLLHVPMEPLDAETYAGPGSLKVGMAAEEITRQMRAWVDACTACTGMNNHMGSRFTTWRPGMDAVLGEAKRSGWFMLDSLTTPDSVVSRAAAGLGVAYAVRDVFLDNSGTSDEVWSSLRRTEEIAARDGLAIAIGHPHDSTLSVLARWLPEARKRGFELVPASAAMVK